MSGKITYKKHINKIKQYFKNTSQLFFYHDIISNSIITKKWT